MDHRVSYDREDVLLKAPEFTPINPSGEEWWEQRYRYFEHAVRRPTYPGAWGPCSVYLDPPNRKNAIDPRTLPGHEELIHVASLNRILRRLASGEYETGEARLRFMELTGHTLPARSPSGPSFDSAGGLLKVDEIVDAAESRGRESVRDLARLFCDTFGQFQPPWWACFAAEAAPLLSAGDAAGLCQVVGLGHIEVGEWLLVWRYDMRLLEGLYPGIPLFRPTVIEANDSPFHHPPPPIYRYGITMPLALGRGALREVIHPPLLGAAAGEACTGTLLRVAKPPLADHNELADLRKAHRRRLLADFAGPETSNWLDRHSPLP